MTTIMETEQRLWWSLVVWDRRMVLKRLKVKVKESNRDGFIATFKAEQTCKQDGMRRGRSSQD